MQVPDEAVQAALARRADLLSDRPDPMVLSEERLTREMLEAAAPILAERLTVPDYPALATATEAIRGELKSSREVDPEALARVALEAAAPILAEAWKPKRPARKPKREVLARCQWCFKHNRTASEYEQRGLDGVWHRLCVRCANRRLGNPWNALLSMRKIGSEVNDSAPAGTAREDERQ